MHSTSFNKMKAFVESYLKDYRNQELTIIDLGSQSVESQPTYKPLFDNPKWKYVGVDLVQGLNVDVLIKDPYKWDQFEDNSVDIVISGQTFEHIEFPWLTIKEIFRVLKDKGITCIIAPSSGYEHRFPVDCWRFYPDGMKALAKWAGFDIVEVFTDWGLDLWEDTFALLQKPITGSYKIAPFEIFSDRQVALKVYLESFKNNPQSLEYFEKSDKKIKKEIKKSRIKIIFKKIISNFYKSHK